MAVRKEQFNQHLKTLLAVAIAVGVIIALRLLDIQVLHHNDYVQLAERNRTQILYQTAPRGRVFTADGVAIASNAPSFSLYYLGGSQQEQNYLQQLAGDIAPYINMAPSDILVKLEEGRKTGKATVLIENLSTKSTVALQELQQYYPGIYLLEESKRDYPYGSLASHLLGY